MNLGSDGASGGSPLRHEACTVLCMEVSRPDRRGSTVHELVE